MCRDVIGEPSPWIAHQFDSAVTWFGQYVEGKVLETGNGGKPRYDLETLLRSKAENTALSLAKAMKRGYVTDRR